MPERYRIAVGHTPEELAEAVNAAIEEGFSPIGGVVVVDRFYQALVKPALPSNLQRPRRGATP